MVLKALLEDARLLVCDNPFDSLDPGTVAALNEALSRAVASGASVVLLLSNRSDIPAWVERFAHIDEGLMTVFDGESRAAQLAQLEASVESRSDCAAGYSRRCHSARIV